MNARSRTKADASDGAPSGIAVVTIHGIGPYQAGDAIEQLSGSDAGRDWIISAQKVDFDWCAVVETAEEDSDKLRQFSRALTEAAQLYGEERLRPGGAIGRFLGAALEAWFKLLWIWPALLVVVLAPFLAVYIRMGRVPQYVEVMPETTLAVWLAMLWWSGIAVSVVVAIAGVLLILGQRTLVVTVLRRVVLIIFHPAVCLLLRLGSREAVDTLRASVKFTVAYGLVVFLVHSCSPDAGQQWAGLTPGNMLLAAAAFAVCLGLAVWLAKVIASPLKLGRDIFNYIGDRGQRQAIQRALDKELTKINHDASVIVIGHSLGSVIALDSLSNSPHWARFSRVCLITAGSPIRRFFQLFFPCLFFPSTMKETLDHLTNRLPLAKWINVYRAGFGHGDPVGQNLFAKDDRGIDIPIWQTARKGFKAHTGYWNDEESEVHKPVQTVMTERPDIARYDRPRDASPAWTYEVQRLDRLHDALCTVSQSLLAACICAGAILSIAGFYMVVNERRAEAREFLANVRSMGVATTAELSHRTSWWGYGEQLDFPVEFFEFTLTDGSGTPRSITFREVESSPFEHGYYFDTSALLQDLPEGHGRDDRFIYEVEYIPGVDGQLTLADPRFEPKPSGYPYFSILFQGLLPVSLTLVLLLWVTNHVVNASMAVLVPHPLRMARAS